MKNRENDLSRRLMCMGLVLAVIIGTGASNQCRADMIAVAPYAPIAKSEKQEQVAEIELFVGESRVFPTPDVARIAVGNAQVITAAALDDKDTIVFANGPGTSTLFVWNQDGRYQRIKVNVVPGDVSRVAREVAIFLSTIPNAKTSVVGDKVIVEGDELSDADRDKVAELTKRYPQIINFTSPIGWEQMVMMDVKVVEFPRTELRDLGLKWSAVGGAAIGSIWAPFRRNDQRGLSITTGGGTPPVTAGDATTNLAPQSLTVLSALNLGLSAQLNALEQNGTASILAEPQLSTRSGYKASFLAGGEVPYSVATVNGVTVQFKPYGIKLDIEPHVGRNGIVRAVIESEVSSIDASFTATGGPGLLTRRTKTEFNVRQGETIVLSGLLQRNNSTDIDKVPLLGDLPILGTLFRSKRFQNKETELVVFVTPTIVDSHSPGPIDRMRRAGERLEQHLGAPPFLTDPLQPGRDAGKVNQTPPAKTHRAAPIDRAN
jgi:pilus assembly protein CpaC